MCHSLEYFVNLKPISGHNFHITIPDGRKVCVNMVRDIPLLGDIVLKNVLYVLNFQFNVVSVQRLCADNALTLLFIHTHCLIQAPLMKTPLVLGRLFHGLYCTPSYITPQHSDDVLTPSQATLPAHNNTPPATHDMAHLWHLRLGHTSNNTLKLMCPSIDIKTIKRSICTIFRK